jgi:hypothetical protein
MGNNTTIDHLHASNMLTVSPSMNPNVNIPRKFVGEVYNLLVVRKDGRDLRVKQHKAG